MRLGFLTNCLVKQGMSDFGQLAAWAAANGFEDLEVGPTVPLDKELYSSVLSKGDIRITSLTYCRNYLSNDEEEAALHISELKKRVIFASELGIEKIVTSTGIDKSVEEGVYDRADSIRKIPIRSLDRVERTFAPVVELCEEKHVKLAFENCPLMGNIAISPVMWRAVLSRLDSPWVGLTYDPSHLVWQMIDPYSYIEEFAGKIFHIHAKDTVIDRKRLGECGILTDFSWWHYVIPGHGELDWRRLMDAFKACGYDGTVSIEHEDRYYEGDLESMKKGILLSRSYLKEFI